MNRAVSSQWSIVNRPWIENVLAELVKIKKIIWHKFEK